MTDPQKPQRAPSLSDAMDYWIDAAQRSALFLDVMRQRGEQYRDHAAAEVPHVLDYKAELVLDGRSLKRPVNYLLVRITPPKDMPVDPVKRPFVIVDPRAGHGPGIGGFKADSEIGVAMAARHVCYFVGFLPEPVPGQTIEDVVAAEAAFLEKVIALHPEAEGKPCVVGNCQAGWQLMMVNALRPELFGPIIVAGSPLSYWAGVRGVNPMRYSGGLLGGSWLTALTGDLGAGKFDGAWLVQNFENQNPANTLWSKQYNLYSKIDTESERYLGFEKWWGGHVTLNAEEMQFIVDELFVGNKLASGEIRTADGTAIDLRNIRSPIVVFCSKGDNITPPQQALDWILDLYESDDEIRAHGQTIVYAIHEKIGHLGIFVSAGVAKKEHAEFASNIDFIDVLPPGLYEAVLEPKGEAVENPDLVTGDWVMRCERRTLDDIRALGGNTGEDERRFAAAARLSEINLAIYRTFAQPWVKAMALPAVAEAMRRMHPLRTQYEMFGPGAPIAGAVAAAAKLARENRRPVSAGNPFFAMQEAMSRQIESGLDTFRETAERLSEQAFHAIYGSPVLQSAMGVAPATERPRKAARSLLHERLIESRIAELRARMGEGGVREALARALCFVGQARGAADERVFAAISAVRRALKAEDALPLPQFKAMFREQFLMLLIDEDEALATLPTLLPAAAEDRRRAFELLQRIATAPGAMTDEMTLRMNRIESLFDLDGAPPTALGWSGTPTADVRRLAAARGRDRADR